MYGIDYENPWLVEVERKGRAFPALGAALAGALAALAILAGARFLGSPLLVSTRALFGSMSEGWSLALASAVVQLLVFGLLLAVAFIGLRIEHRRVGAPGGRRWLWVVAGLALGGLGFLASAEIAGAVGRLTPSGASPLQPVAAGAALGLALILVQCFSEEMLFRGWMQPLLCARLGPWLGLGSTSILFGAFHAIAGVAGPLALLNMTLGGLVFGLLALRSGGLTAATSAHFAWNWTESGGMGLEPSPTGGLVNFSLDGPALWSGGSERMNGSLATTLVLLAIAVGLALVGPRGRRPA